MIINSTSFSAGATPAAEEGWKVFGIGPVDVEVSGSFVATLTVERRCKNDDGTYGAVQTWTFDSPGTFPLTCNQRQPEYRMYVATGAYTSGPLVARVAQG